MNSACPQSILNFHCYKKSFGEGMHPNQRVQKSPVSGAVALEGLPVFYDLALPIDFLVGAGS